MAMLETLMVLVMTGMSLSRAQGVFRPRCESAFQWIRDPRDCSHFWRCVWGRPVEMPRCHPGTVLSARLKVCVYPGGPHDDCRDTDDQGELTIAERCARGERLIPHPTECQTYYNCSIMYRTIPRYYEQFLTDCPYPRLFDQNQLRCRDFSDVRCGDRLEPVNACQYRRNWCPVAHCEPCELANPSCEFLPDGPNVFPRREWTPNFLECRSGRTVAVGECPVDNDFRVPEVFSPVTNTCVNLFRVPREHGGLLPSCVGRFDGAWPVEENIPGVSFICSGGQLQSLRYCPEGATPNVEPRASLCVFA